MSNNLVTTKINGFVRVLVLTSNLTFMELTILVGLEAGKNSLLLPVIV